MYENFVCSVGNGYYPDPQEDLFKSLFRQYERVIVESLITSFGLDIFISKKIDQYGGDVDTIHNVRKIGTDPEMKYKNKYNAANYDNRGDYSYIHERKDKSGENCKNPADDYHGLNPKYQDTIHNTRKNAIESNGGVIKDAYTGKKVAFSKNAPPDQHASLDHIIAANGIHNDRGRVLSGLSGPDLANSPENLAFTNAGLNSSMRDMDIPAYIENHPELPKETKQNMLKKYEEAKAVYENKIAEKYYTSKKFATDTARAAEKIGVTMAARQALGFLFANIWFEIKAEFEKEDLHVSPDLDLGKLFDGIQVGVKRGIEKTKSMDTVVKAIEGFVSGAFSSITTTICNIFFTTAKNIVRIIRNAYASIVEAGKIILINPQNYPFGERMRAAAKVLAVGASVVLGNVVMEAVSKTAIACIPVIGDVVKEFCGTLCTGVLSCTFLFYLDKSKVINSVIEKLNMVHTIEDDIYYYQQQAQLFEKYAAELMMIDLDEFHHQTEVYSQISRSITTSTKPEELNIILKNSLHTLGVTMVWEKDYKCFDDFMNDKSSKMVFL